MLFHCDGVKYLGIFGYLSLHLGLPTITTLYAVTAEVPRRHRSSSERWGLPLILAVPSKEHSSLLQRQLLDLLTRRALFPLRAPAEFPLQVPTATWLNRYRLDYSGN